MRNERKENQGQLLGSWLCELGEAGAISWHGEVQGRDRLFWGVVVGVVGDCVGEESKTQGLAIANTMPYLLSL